MAQAGQVIKVKIGLVATFKRLNLPWKARDIAEIIRTTKDAQIDKAFDTEGESIPGGWLPHRPLTTATGGEKVLTRTGMLRDSIHVRATVRKQTATITIFSSLYVEGGFNLGLIHQRGVDGPILPVRAPQLAIPRVPNPSKSSDYIFLKGIFPTPEKNDQAIPARPFATMTREDRREIIDNILYLFRQSMRGRGRTLKGKG